MPQGQENATRPEKCHKARKPKAFAGILDPQSPRKFYDWRGKRAQKTGIARLYDHLVSQARSPWFYDELGVEDHFDGRLSCLLFHIILPLHVLHLQAPKAQTPWGSLLLTHFFQDCDRALRDANISDVRIARRMKQIAAAYQGCAQAITHALAPFAPGSPAASTEQEREVQACVQRNLLGGKTVAPSSLVIGSAYLIRSFQQISLQSPSALLHDGPAFAPLPTPPTAKPQSSSEQSLSEHGS